MSFEASRIPSGNKKDKNPCSFGAFVLAEAEKQNKYVDDLVY